MLSRIHLAGAFLFLLSAPAWAHHKFMSEYDQNKPLTLTGTVANVEWSDPHVYVQLNVVNSSGVTEQWRLEGASSQFLTANGWSRNSLKAGDKITAEAFASSSKANMASTRAVTLPDGRKVSMSDAAEDGGPRPANVVAMRTDVGDTLPSTGSPFPAIGLAGLISVSLALGMRTHRVFANRVK